LVVLLSFKRLNVLPEAFLIDNAESMVWCKGK
jgi:hypothetical protein